MKLWIFLVSIIWSSTWTHVDLGSTDYDARAPESSVPLGLTAMTLNVTNCPTWTVLGTDNKCYCGSRLNGVVHCDDQTLELSMLPCNCMSYSESANRTVVGYCPFTCFHMGTYFQVDTNASNLEDFNEGNCNSLLNFSRTGQMCGKCKEGYAPPVYSYSLACVECSDYKYNWLKYIAIAFLPVTVFYIIVIVFRVSVTSPAMIGYVLISQIITIPTQVQFTKISVNMKKPAQILAFHLSTVAYGMWNLDFLRGVFKPFCLHPKLAFFHTFLLDYALAVYPMFLIIITYLLVNLHDNSRKVRLIWRPLYKCLVQIRRKWNIQSSLVSAFATFILLSYVKILNTSFQILTPTRLYDVNGDQLPQLYLYYNGKVEYFGKQHLPYAVLALFMFTVFNMFPLLLLCLYPCQCFQRCLNCCKIQWPSLHIFMDSFHGCYKLKPYDCRYFAAFYLALRIINDIVIASTTSDLYYPFTTLTFSFAATLTALARPYNGKHQLYTAVDVLMFMILALFTLLYTTRLLAKTTDPIHLHHTYLPILLLGVVPPLYGISLLLYKVVPRRVFIKVKRILFTIKQWACRFSPLHNSGEIFDEDARIMYEYNEEVESDDSNTPLLQVSHSE